MSRRSLIDGVPPLTPSSQPSTWSTTMYLDPRATTCAHEPTCPAFSDPDHDAAVVLARHPEQGWSLLCNGVVLFEDTGELLPDGRTVAPHRPACRLWSAA